ncbi:uncharacterized protein G2W53_018488 [Senna tora]|uniref:Uncharacterized protein n=1 Tax=Senna tora TaxID=362788 RepID=A0A834U0M8_9FABA|nr:uncharacterized protein G2W53_018488 [Senna tora]
MNVDAALKSSGEGALGGLLRARDYDGHLHYRRSWSEAPNC